MISIIHPSRDTLEFVSFRRFKRFDPCTSDRFSKCEQTIISATSSTSSSSS
ncbi:Protein CBG20735 [Caenorhabditis briggsae]|uniref:Protein CBG20735 n=1 Tax=Caenorhabditis briggsae TaxID=6238 RepID=A8XYH4_CAEBR|nr:Protein CBG20735 [Caenorhabditis briggsae]CAP37691.1 Protein CBG20735 [Caenorhabditis briggsae]